MYKIVFVLLVKMQIELASHLKDKGVKIVKKPLNVERYIKELKQTKLLKYWTCP